VTTGLARVDEAPDHPTTSRLLSSAGIIVAAYIVFVGVGTALGLLIVHVIDHGRIGGDDSGLVAALARHRTDFLNHLTAFLSGMANTIPIILAALVVAIVWRIVAKQWNALALLAIGLVLEVTSFVTIAALVGRDRPDVVRLDQSPPTSSYPSGHTAATTVLYGAIAVLVFSRTRRTGPRVLAVAVAVLVPAAVGYGRLYRGMHHPSDVIVGALLGASALAVAVFVVRRWQAESESGLRS
jgi:membrane-associated phospholipid phosphatase